MQRNSGKLHLNVGGGEEQPPSKDTEEMEAEGDSAAEMNGEEEESEEERSGSQTESEEESSGEPHTRSSTLPAAPSRP